MNPVEGDYPGDFEEFLPVGVNGLNSGAYEYDFGWYVDGTGDIIRKPTVSGITSFLDEPPACLEFESTVEFVATVSNTDISDRFFDNLLFILQGAEADTFTVSDSLVVLPPGSFIVYPFNYTVPSGFPQGHAVCRIEANLGGVPLHQTGDHTRVSACLHNMNDIED